MWTSPGLPYIVFVIFIQVHSFSHRFWICQNVLSLTHIDRRTCEGRIYTILLRWNEPKHNSQAVEFRGHSRFIYKQHIMVGLHTLSSQVGTKRDWSNWFKCYLIYIMEYCVRTGRTYRPSVTSNKRIKDALRRHCLFTVSLIPWSKVQTTHKPWNIFYPHEL